MTAAAHAPHVAGQERPAPGRGADGARVPGDRPPGTAYPFSAVVGMEDMCLALLLNAVSPAVGGVLVRGEKGTAKSTTVRALSVVLPPVAVVDGCRFSCDPAAPDAACPDGPHPPDAQARSRPARLVELPVGASEDRVVGSLDLERALTAGVRSFEPGLLAAAHRGVLYVDEVNLLHDHLVDLLLDAAALGTAYVEREGVSVRHGARFLLVGTMNPEEGELRPQLLDRFGLTAQVAAPRDPELRAEVVRRRFASDADPAAFAARWADEEAGLAERIAAARRRLPDVVLGDDALRQVTAVCAAFEVDGLRGDIVTARAAVAHAAWCGRTAVTEEDVRAAARLALPHRRRRNPFDAPGLDEDVLDEALERSRPDPRPDGPGTDGPRPDGPGTGRPQGPDDQRADDRGGDPRGDAPDPGAPDPPGASGGQGPRDAADAADAADAEPSGDHGAPGADAAAADTPPGQPQPPPGRPGAGTPRAPAPTGDPFRVRRIEVAGVGAGAAGRRSRARTERGRVVGAERPVGRVARVNLPATLQAAAPHQRDRGRRGPGLVLARADLRQAVTEGREANLVLFVVDASGSMGARSRMSAVKGALLSLLLDAYQRRDTVCLVTFRGERADLALPPTWSVDAAASRLGDLPTGGRTPLAAGLLLAERTLVREALRDPRRRPLLVVVTDGRATGRRGTDPVAEAHRAAGLLRRRRVSSVVVDCETGPVRLGLAGVLAAHLAGPVLRMEQLAADRLAGAVRELRTVA